MAKAAISIPMDLLEQFDYIVREKDYSSRSEAIQNALRQYIQYYEWMKGIKGERAGTIIVLYDGMKKCLIESIAGMQQDFREIICSTLQLPVNNIFLLISIICYLKHFTQDKIISLSSVKDLANSIPPGRSSA